MLRVYHLKKSTQCMRAYSIEPNPLRKSGRYFRILNSASDYGLSLETCGLECIFMIPRSARSNATGLEVVEDRRLKGDTESRWIVLCGG